MSFLDKIKKKLSKNNNHGPDHKESLNREDSVMEELDNTIIDADKRIKEMLEEMRR